MFQVGFIPSILKHLLPPLFENQMIIQDTFLKVYKISIFFQVLHVNSWESWA